MNYNALIEWWEVGNCHCDRHLPFVTYMFSIRGGSVEMPFGHSDKNEHYFFAGTTWWEI